MFYKKTLSIAERLLKNLRSSTDSETIIKEAKALPHVKTDNDNQLNRYETLVFEDNSRLTINRRVENQTTFSTHWKCTYKRHLVRSLASGDITYVSRTEEELVTLINGVGLNSISRIISKEFSSTKYKARFFKAVFQSNDILNLYREDVPNLCKVYSRMTGFDTETGIVF